MEMCLRVTAKVFHFSVCAFTESYMYMSISKGGIKFFL